MSIFRGFAIIFIFVVSFAVVGGLLGFGLGVGVPSYYRTVVVGGDDPDFNPVLVGLGLGIPQGAVSGLVIGSVLVLARRAVPAARSEGQAGRSGG